MDPGSPTNTKLLIYKILTRYGRESNSPPMSGAFLPNVIPLGRSDSNTNRLVVKILAIASISATSTEKWSGTVLQNYSHPS